MAGRLIYLIGPSGSGKDSLLDAAREPLASRGCRIVRRVITRSAEAKGEAAQAVSVEQFAEMQAQGAFALSWFANGLHYGIPNEIDQWLADGHDVLINGSRGHLPQARARYPDLWVVLLSVDQVVLRQRLLARGRESAQEVEARLSRNAQFADDLLAAAGPANGASILLLDNSGALEQTVARLLQRLDREHACA
ncbi:phosphonate metabolism protein/1,5-bisphosphokinase (PRPP-forming) PhnN [Pseudomonas sp. SLFW]|uniref:phosphonate metabolism protein/1,5-bisphosphokinase (PRPP-forming) PhnN n=1 Tax=Pseudomonas sp. SLFW TaxID=2683259 RepID=UPI0014136951|nr:phosphonate metabolism protein/1,5-bisphosphokinase (PRPP-forming) PhnN [Pseudomonas sp. SLFW]NBB12679.1 phosphonate metabolism protein/1,5-bisphosphokinase (PRPP-forming) PhnN [Pseudomonas sp. SLFW]